MITRGQFPPSNGFRHVTRPLQEGERIPAMPSLFEQLQGCSSEIVRLARERAAAARETEADRASADNGEWEPDMEDAA
jgi:hypothetical protein